MLVQRALGAGTRADEFGYTDWGSRGGSRREHTWPVHRDISAKWYNPTPTHDSSIRISVCPFTSSFGPYLSPRSTALGSVC